MGKEGGREGGREEERLWGEARECEFVVGRSSSVGMRGKGGVCALFLAALSASCLSSPNSLIPSSTFLLSSLPSSFSKVIGIKEAVAEAVDVFSLSSEEALLVCEAADIRDEATLEDDDEVEEERDMDIETETEADTEAEALSSVPPICSFELAPARKDCFCFVSLVNAVVDELLISLAFELTFALAFEFALAFAFVFTVFVFAVLGLELPPQEKRDKMPVAVSLVFALLSA